MPIQQPTKEYGYFPPMTGEEMEKRFGRRNLTDELWIESIGQWHKVTAHTGYSSNIIYRRRIDPGEGYEIVPELGVITPDCDFTTDGIEWKSIKPWRNTHGLQVKFAPKDKSVLAIRRKISTSMTTDKQEVTNGASFIDAVSEWNSKQNNPDCRIDKLGLNSAIAGFFFNHTSKAQPVTPPWIKFSDRMPTDSDYPIQITDGHIFCVFEYPNIPIIINKTHWRSLKSIIPTDLPQPDA